MHIDGFIALQATTICVGKKGTDGDAATVTGRPADALACAQACFDATMRLLRPGKRIADVAGPLGQLADEFGCQLVEGVMTHNMKQFVIDGNKCILNRPTPDQKVEDDEFLENEVYAIDIVISTGAAPSNFLLVSPPVYSALRYARLQAIDACRSLGGAGLADGGVLRDAARPPERCAGEGKARVVDEKQTTVYKRAIDVEYMLRSKASRTLISSINKKFPCMPFPLRLLMAGGSASKFGLVECLSHQMLHPYPVLWEKDGETVVHIKATVLLMPNGSDRVTLAPLQAHKSEKTVQVRCLAHRRSE